MRILILKNWFELLFVWARKKLWLCVFCELLTTDRLFDLTIKSTCHLNILLNRIEYEILPSLFQRHKLKLIYYILCYTHITVNIWLIGHHPNFWQTLIKSSYCWNAYLHSSHSVRFSIWNSPSYRNYFLCVKNSLQFWWIYTDEFIFDFHSICFMNV